MGLFSTPHAGGLCRLLFVCLLAGGGVALGQNIRIGPGGGPGFGVEAPGRGRPGDKKGEPKEPQEPKVEFEEMLPAAVDANAQIDSEANSLFMQAFSFAREGKYELVFRLLDEALALGTHTMASSDGENFLPARHLVISILRNMPKEALQSYRLLTDPISRRRLDEYRKYVREESLLDVYEKRFLSSVGDNAAYALACLRLDQLRFAEARRILSEIVHYHPDTDVKHSDILPRLTLACVRSQDLVGAKVSWNAYLKLVTEVPAKWKGLEQEYKKMLSLQATPTTDVISAYGDFHRRGRMPALTDGKKDALWLVAWVIEHQMPSTQPYRSHYTTPGLSRGNFLSEADMAARMIKHNWRPAEQVVFDGERVWSGSFPSTYCYDLRTGKKIWEGQAHKEATSQRRYYYNPWGRRGARPGKPQTESEKWSFAYRLCRDMSIINQTAYRIEANEKASYSRNLYATVIRNGQRVRAEVPVGNVLTAYDRNTGKLKWRVGRELGAKARVIIEKTEAFNVPEVTGVKIDGQVGDWQGRGLRLNVAGKGKEQQGNMDLEVFAGWNEAGLVIRAKILDSKILEHSDAKELFRGDSLEFFMAEFRGSWNMYQAVTSTGADPKYPEARHQVFDHRRAKRRSSALKLAVQFGHAKIPGGYMVEAMFPWKNLGIKGELGNEVGFQMYANDYDDPKKRWVTSWHKNRDTHANPANMNRVRLADARGRLRGAKASKISQNRKWKVNRVRFIGAPVMSCGRLIVPMEDDMGINLVALDEQNGVPIWQTRVMTIKPASGVPATAANLTVKGPLVYLCSGQGQVACVDAADGLVMWLARYDSFSALMPKEEENPNNNQPPEPEAKKPKGGKKKKAPKGKKEPAGTPKPPPEEPKKEKKPEVPELVLPESWEESLVICDAGRAVALPSDAATMYCFNRMNGERLWTAPKPKTVDYVIGVQNGTILLGGKHHLVAINMETGATAWSVKTGSTTGRAVLSGDEILVPAGKQIWRHLAKTGKVIQKASLRTPGDVPIGNLYVTPRGLLVAGPNRVFLVYDARSELNLATANIKKNGDAIAYAERGRLNFLMNRLREALEDLNIACDKLTKDPQNKQVLQEAQDRFVQAAFDYSRTNPNEAVKFLRKAQDMARNAEDKLNVAWVLGKTLEAAGRTDDAVRAYLAALPQSAGGLLPVELKDGQLMVSGRAAVWRRLAKLRTKISGKVRADIDKTLQTTFAGARSSKDPVKLVRFSQDFSDTNEAKDAILYAAQLFADKGQAAAAVSVLMRLADSKDRDRRRSALVAVVAKILESGNKKATLLLIAYIRGMDSSWQSKELTDLQQLAEGGPANSTLKALSYPLRKAWTTKLKAGRNYLRYNRFEGDYWHFAFQTGDIGTLDLRTGKVVSEQKVPYSVVNQMGTAVRLALTASMDRGSIKVTDFMMKRQYGTFKCTLQGATSADLPTKTGIAAVLSPAHDGTVAAVDLIAKKILWQDSNVHGSFGQASQRIQCRTKGEKFTLYAYSSPQRRYVVRSYDLATGKVSSEKMDSRKISSLISRSYSSQLRGPDAIPGLEHKSKRLRLRDPKTKRTVWETPAGLKVAEHYHIAKDYSIVKTDGNGFAVVRLTDGKVIVDRSKTKYEWPRIYRNHYNYFRSLFIHTPGSNFVLMRMSMRSPYRMVGIDLKKGKVSFDRKMPDTRTYPIAYLGNGVMLVRATIYKQEGNRRRYMGTKYRFLGNDGKFLPGEFPPKKDIKAGTSSSYFQFFTGPGILLVLDRRAGAVHGYVSDTKPIKKQ